MHFIRVSLDEPAWGFYLFPYVRFGHRFIIGIEFRINKWFYCSRELFVHSFFVVNPCNSYIHVRDNDLR